MNQLYDKYSADGLRILAFPCNQFANQESGSGVDLQEFMRKQKVKFDVYEKTLVNGNDAHPLWKYLKSKQGGGLGVDFIKWNFTKFLVNKQGIPVNRYAPTVSPLVSLASFSFFITHDFHFLLPFPQEFEDDIKKLLAE